MAGEIRVNFQFDVSKGSFNDNFSLVSQTYDMAGAYGGVPGAITVGTTEETLAFGELATEGFLIMKNLDATNYVRFGFSTGVYGGRILPGEIAFFRMEPSVTLYLVANVSPVRVQIKGYDA